MSGDGDDENVPTKTRSVFLDALYSGYEERFALEEED